MPSIINFVNWLSVSSAISALWAKDVYKRQEGDTVISKLADDCIELPETLECLEPLIATVPLQLLACLLYTSERYQFLKR